MYIKPHVPVKTAEADITASSIAAGHTGALSATPKMRRVTLDLRAEPGNRIFLAGTFNNWNPTATEMTDKKGNGVYSATLTLPEGIHQYKFVVDGTWCADPECDSWVQNEYGTHNSLLTV